MGKLRRTAPDVARRLLEENSFDLQDDFHSKGTKTFFQTKKISKTVFVDLQNDDKWTRATETSSMIALATDYYKELYKEPSSFDKAEVEEFLSPLTVRLFSESDQLELDKPFTQQELLYALQSSHGASSPGPDGIQFPLLSGFAIAWDNESAAFLMDNSGGRRGSSHPTGSGGSFPPLGK